MVMNFRLKDGKVLVKEGAVFLGIGDSGRTSLSGVDLERGGYRLFLFVLENLDRCCSNIRILVSN